MSWEAPVRFRVSVVVAALVLTGCNANQAINPSGQAGRCANDAHCDPYNPISYAQNNTGNRGGVAVEAGRRLAGERWLRRMLRLAAMAAR